MIYHSQKPIRFAGCVLLCVAFPIVSFGQQGDDPTAYGVVQEAGNSGLDVTDEQTSLSDVPRAAQPANNVPAPARSILGSNQTEPTPWTTVPQNCNSCETGNMSSSSKPNPCATSHKPVFYDNNFSYLNDENYCGDCLGDAWKQHKTGPCGNLDIGGQVRFRYHHEQGMGQQAGFTRFQNTTNDFGLARTRLYADWKANENFRFYAEGIYSSVMGANTEYVPRGIDQNFGDLLNLFADITLTESTTVRIGRQELLYGAQRLVSPLDWSNTRRTFSGVKTMSKFDNLSVDTFFTQLVNVAPNDFDKPDEEVDFYGAYATYTGRENRTLDFYYLGLNDDRGVTGIENLNTLGSRLQGSTANKLLYETESMFQFGNRDLTGEDISAYGFTGGLGYQFADLPMKPTLWGFYDYASGDEFGSGEYERFNELFPLGHKYLGFVDAVQRQNIQAPNLRLTLAPTKKLSLLFWYYNFQTPETADTIASLGGTPLQDPTSDDFGNELDIAATYTVNHRSNLVTGYSHLWRGSKIIGDTDADFFYMQWTTNF